MSKVALLGSLARTVRPFVAVGIEVNTTWYGLGWSPTVGLFLRLPGVVWNRSEGRIRA
jgi:hypothetical protein